MCYSWGKTIEKGDGCPSGDTGSRSVGQGTGHTGCLIGGVSSLASFGSVFCHAHLHRSQLPRVLVPKLVFIQHVQLHSQRLEFEGSDPFVDVGWHIVDSGR
jgi:hypothetical protein